LGPGRTGPIISGLGVGQVAIWLSGIDTECECAVPVVIMVPGGSCASALLTKLKAKSATSRATGNNFTARFRTRLSVAQGECAQMLNSNKNRKFQRSAQRISLPTGDLIREH
jgi:hypothetical protein